MKKQLIEELLSGKRGGFRTNKPEFIGRDISLEIAICGREDLLVSGKLQHLTYPSIILISDISQVEYRSLLRNPAVKNRNFVYYIKGAESLYGMILDSWNTTTRNKLKNTLRVFFISPEHAIKTISMDGNVMYTSPFVDSQGFYSGFEDSTLIHENELRRKHGFPEIYSN